MFKQLSVEDASQLLLQEDVIILDIRDVDSFQSGHIANAKHLTMQELQKFCELTPRSYSIVVYCYHGISSQAVAAHLVDQGFPAVYSVIGGYEEWKKKIGVN